MNTRKHQHTFTRSKPGATVETCACGRFRFTENAGPSIVAVTDHSEQTRKNNALMLKIDRERERRRYDRMSNAQRLTYTNSDR